MACGEQAGMLLTLFLLLALADTVREDFVASSWPKVHAAADALSVTDVSPVLLVVMGRDAEVVLQDSADLIYPGAQRFYGHGLVVDYELNWLAGRAGWVLEGLTFESFGFKQGDVTTADVLNAAGTMARGRPTEELRHDPQVKAALRKRAVQRAQEWWKNQGGKFDRDAAARAALFGTDAPKQRRVLVALRNKQLPFAPYRGVVERLQHSLDEEVRKQADALMR